MNLTFFLKYMKFHVCDSSSSQLT